MLKPTCPIAFLEEWKEFVKGGTLSDAVLFHLSDVTIAMGPTQTRPPHLMKPVAACTLPVAELTWNPTAVMHWFVVRHGENVIAMTVHLEKTTDSDYQIYIAHTYTSSREPYPGIRALHRRLNKTRPAGMNRLKLTWHCRSTPAHAMESLWQHWTPKMPLSTWDPPKRKLMFRCARKCCWRLTDGANIGPFEDVSDDDFENVCFSDTDDDPLGLFE